MSTLGVRLNFDKRYITLAPIATVVGLAFQLKDPKRLLGPSGEENVGITLALLPKETPGLKTGRRHFPLNVPFQNGTVKGRDVFIPLEYLIGGATRACQGWKMLVECLSGGRAVSLPSMSSGTATGLLAGTSAYAQVREQFGVPLHKFEGIQMPLGRMVGKTYLVQALAQSSERHVDRGERPGITSAMAKYHATELGRQIVQDAMDIHGGKGIVLGPSNYIGRAWQGAPISITVEGANILTRNLIIFGQGLVRAHPFILKELRALSDPSPMDAARALDEVLWKHVGHFIKNALKVWKKIGMARGP